MILVHRLHTKNKRDENDNIGQVKDLVNIYMP